MVHMNGYTYYVYIHSLSGSTRLTIWETVVYHFISKVELFSRLDRKFKQNVCIKLVRFIVDSWCNNFADCIQSGNTVYHTHFILNSAVRAAVKQIRSRSKRKSSSLCSDIRLPLQESTFEK